MRSKFKWIFTLLVAFTMQFSFAQEKTVTGVVTDGKTTLPGVNVVIKGTTKGVSTDFDGKYSIKAKVGETLVFSAIDYETKNVSVGSDNSYNVKLKSAATKLDEVMVTGAVGIKKKKDAVTATNQVVTNAELKAASNPDAVRALVGKVSGVTINGTSNGVNGSNSIKIRSSLSIGGNNEALVVIDDVISNATVLASLPPDAIQSMNILKGAQGAALYGSQGKSGVVIVTTKKGSKTEKFSVSFNSSFDVESIAFMPQTQGKYGQGWFGTWDQYENGGWGELLDGSIRPVGLVQPDGSYIESPYSAIKDNIKDYYKNGQIFQNNIGLNFGGKDGYANLNLGNLRKDFIVEGDNLNRNTVVFNAGKKINKFSIAGAFTYVNTYTKQSNVDTTLQGLLQAASNVPVGLFDNNTPNGWTVYYRNPFWTRDNNRLKQKTDFVNIGFNLGYDLNEHINLSYKGSVQNTNNNQISYSNMVANPQEAIDYQADLSQGSSFYQFSSSAMYYYGDLMANFDYNLTQNIGLKFNVGQNMQYSTLNRLSQGGNNLEIPGWYNIQNVLNPVNASLLRNAYFDDRTAAFFGNADLNYKDYLFFNATLRYEGNSKLPKANRWVPYYSAGTSFIATKALDVLKDSKMNNLKLYANYTKIGSGDPINTYAIEDLSGLGSGYPFPNTGNSFNNFSSITNPNIKSETYTTIEVGANFGFFKDRLTFDVAAYRTQTKDLITRSSLDYATGAPILTDNIGELQAKGLELDLGFTPIKNENFTWSGRASFTTYDTKVIKAGATSQINVYDISADTNIDAAIVAIEGESFPYIIGTDFVRDANGNVIVNATSGSPSVTPEFQKLGKVTPDYILGLTNNFNYKGIGLSFTMDYRTGHSVISESKYELTWSGKLVESGEVDRENGWILPGSVVESSPGVYTENTTVLTGGNYTSPTNNKTQNYFGLLGNTGKHNLIDATALKVREISLSYSLPSKLIKNTGMASLKLSLNARNPFVVFAKDNRGYTDPEASSQYNQFNTTAARAATGNTSVNGSGYSAIGQYPSTRTFGFALNATF